MFDVFNYKKFVFIISIWSNYIGDELAWDVNLVLLGKAVKPTKLNGQFRLGWTTWLGKRPDQTDVDDLILHAITDVDPSSVGTDQ